MSNKINIYIDDCLSLYNKKLIFYKLRLDSIKELCDISENTRYIDLMILLQDFIRSLEELKNLFNYQYDALKLTP